MAQEFNLNTSVSEIFSPIQKNNLTRNNSADNDFHAHEVFRNDTTAVEIIVKQVKNKKVQAPNTIGETEVVKLCQDVEHLRNELNKANKNLEEAKKCFRLVLFEMSKQLEAANQADLKRQTQILVLQLEKEKLSSVLELRTKLLARMRKEVLDMRRVIKFVNRGIRGVPHFHASELSESEYAAFVNNLKDFPQQCETGDENVTNDTTLSSKI